MKFIYPFFTLFLITSLLACSTYESSNPTASSTLVKVNSGDDFPTLTGVALGISANVYLKQGNKQSVEFEGDKEVIDNLSRKVKNGVWYVKFKEKNKIRNYKLDIYITLRDLEEVSIGGSGDIIGQNTFTKVDDLDIAIGGSGNVELDVDASSIEASIGGSGDIKLKGSSKDLDVSIAGSGSVAAIDLESSSCSISIAGSGDCKVNVKDNLNVSIVGSGDVLYKGNPTIKKSKLGSGSISPL